MSDAIKMNMIERVARAIWNDACPGIHPTMDDIKHYRAMAKAAIQAMRYLSPEMLLVVNGRVLISDYQQ